MAARRPIRSSARSSSRRRRRRRPGRASAAPAARTPKSSRSTRAGERARGATLYCTLEPCATSAAPARACERIVAAGISRVVAAIVDPNPACGRPRASPTCATTASSVTDGVGEAAARRLNAPFFTWVTQGRPFVIAKVGSVRRRIRRSAPATGPLYRRRGRPVLPSAARRGRRDRGRLRHGAGRRSAAHRARRLPRSGR